MLVFFCLFLLIKTLFLFIIAPNISSWGYSVVRYYSKTAFYSYYDNIDLSLSFVCL